MMVLGIDPGLNVTGYGIIETNPSRVVCAGDVRPPRKQSLSERLAFLHEELSRVFCLFKPDAAVLEMVFTHKSYPNTAALLGHARGVACLAVQEQGIRFFEYPPARIKRALTGQGNASKNQVARMLGQWLSGVDASWSADTTDALALAVAHAQMLQAQETVLMGRQR